MKLIDTRDGTVMEGEPVAVLPANKPVFEADMRRYYKLAPSDRAYKLLAAPWPQERVVLRRGDQVDAHYYIVPRYDFYRVEE